MSKPEEASTDGNKENKTKTQKWKMADFKLGKALGKGRFGSVYLAKEKKSNYVVGKKFLLRNWLFKLVF